MKKILNKLQEFLDQLSTTANPGFRGLNLSPHLHQITSYYQATMGTQNISGGGNLSLPVLPPCIRYPPPGKQASLSQRDTDTMNPLVLARYQPLRQMRLHLRRTNVPRRPQFLEVMIGFDNEPSKCRPGRVSDCRRCGHPSSPATPICNIGPEGVNQWRLSVFGTGVTRVQDRPTDQTLSPQCRTWRHSPSDGLPRIWSACSNRVSDKLERQRFCQDRVKSGRELSRCRLMTVTLEGITVSDLKRGYVTRQPLKSGAATLEASCYGTWTVQFEKKKIASTH